jgi:hypothetical protein
VQGGEIGARWVRWIMIAPFIGPYGGRRRTDKGREAVTVKL